MTERERSSDTTPVCPKCGSSRIEGLRADDLYRRFNCLNPGCSQGQFIVKRDGFASALAEEKEKRRRLTESEVIEMGKGKKEPCAKGCGRLVPLGGPGRSAHDRHCDGTPKAEKPARQKKPAPPRSSSRALTPAAAAPPAAPALPVGSHISQVPEHMAGTPLGEAVSLLLRRRADLQQELDGVDQAVKTIVRQSAAAAIGEAAGRTFRKLD